MTRPRMTDEERRALQASLGAAGLPDWLMERDVTVPEPVLGALIGTAQAALKGYGTMPSGEPTDAEARLLPAVRAAVNVARRALGLQEVTDG